MLANVGQCWPMLANIGAQTTAFAAKAQPRNELRQRERVEKSEQPKEALQGRRQD